MARKARARAESGIYYAEINGNNKLVFIENDDYRFFLDILLSAAAEDFTEICAYVMLPEKISLVVKEGLGGISELVRKVLPKYTARYNRKYSREGKLFRDRFRSLPLETEEETLDAVRYVHRLPIEAGEKEGLKYPFSSFNDYDKGNRKDDTVMLLCGLSLQKFRLEMDEQPAFGKKEKKLSDGEIAAILREKLAGRTSEEIENMSEREQGAIVRFLHEQGVSIRRMATLLGVSKSAVEKSLKRAGGRA